MPIISKENNYIKHKQISHHHVSSVCSSTSSLRGIESKLGNIIMQSLMCEVSSLTWGHEYSNKVDALNLMTEMLC